MNPDFVTVATFPDPTTAHLANQHLEAAGIRGFLADENMDPIFGNAIGWIKLQVSRDDAVRATAVLEAKLPPPDDSPPSDEITTARDGIQAGAEEDDDPDDEVEEQERRRGMMLDEKLTSEPDPETEPPPLGLTETRSRTAERAFMASLTGLVIPPVLVYALYLILIAATSSGTLTSRANVRLWLAAAITPTALLAWYSIFRIVGGG